MIGCMGAISICELPNDSDGVAADSITAIKLNGVLYPNIIDIGFKLPNSIAVNFKRRPIIDGGGFNWGYYIELVNLSNTFMHVELIGYSPADNSSGVEVHNPTLSIDNAITTVCLSPKVPCAPTVLEIPIDPLFSGNQTLYYRVNEGQVLSVTHSFEGSGGIGWLLQVINANYGQRLFTFGGGGSAAFHYSNGLRGATGDGIEPITVTLLDLNGSTVVNSVFGVSLIVLHACGFEDFVGV